MVLSAGNNQADTVDATLAIPFSVTILDSTNAPVPGVLVTWTVPANQGSVSSATVATAGNGVAAVDRTLGPTAGTQTAQASAAGVSGSPVTFTATATAGTATLIVKSGGDSGSGQVSSQVTYSVTATDRRGNPRAGVVIDWAVGTGGGSITPAQNSTGSNGTASATRTLGPSAGDQTATARANGIASAPSVTFTTTAVVGAAVTVGPNIQFSPTAVTIPVGGRVTWTWATNSLSHSVQWLTGPAPLPASSAVQTSGTYAVTFTTAGTYTYNCFVHGNGMTGSVVVQ
jgi:plastocyanin